MLTTLLNPWLWNAQQANTIVGAQAPQTSTATASIVQHFVLAGGGVGEVRKVLPYFSRKPIVCSCEGTQAPQTCTGTAEMIDVELEAFALFMALVA